MKRKVCFALAAAFAIVLALIILPTGEAQRSEPNESGAQTPNSLPEQSYRSPGDRHKLRVDDENTAREVEALGGRLIADYQGFKLYDVSTAVATSFAERTAAHVADDSNLVLLNSSPIDTTTAAAQAMRSAGSGGGKGMRL